MIHSHTFPGPSANHSLVRLKRRIPVGVVRTVVLAPAPAPAPGPAPAPAHGPAPLNERKILIVSTEDDVPEKEKEHDLLNGQDFPPAPTGATGILIANPIAIPCLIRTPDFFPDRAIAAYDAFMWSRFESGLSRLAAYPTWPFVNLFINPKQLLGGIEFHNLQYGWQLSADWRERSGTCSKLPRNEAGFRGFQIKVQKEWHYVIDVSNDPWKIDIRLYRILPPKLGRMWHGLNLLPDLSIHGKSKVSLK